MAANNNNDPVPVAAVTPTPADLVSPESWVFYEKQRPTCDDGATDDEMECLDE